MDSSTEHSPAIDVGPKQHHAVIAFVLALLSSYPDLPSHGTFPFGRAMDRTAAGRRSDRAGVACPLRAGQGTGLATAAIVIAGLMIAQMAVWTVVSLVS